MKLTDEKTKELKEQFREEIAHEFDINVTRKMTGKISRFLHRFFLKKTILHGLSNLRNIPEGTPVIISAVHKSHIDYLSFGTTLYESGDGLVPATIGGSNLFHGKFEKLLPQLKCVALDRDRVTPKKLRSRENLLYLSTFYDYLMEDVIDKGEMITIFPEGGRSYSGKILRLNLGIFGIAKRAINENNKRVAIVPIGLSYDRITEDCRFDGLRKYKEWNPRAYRKYDKRGFIHHAIFQPRTIAYIDIGEPMYIEEFRKLDKLEKELRTRMGKLIRVTPVTLVCRAIAGKKNTPLDEVIKHIREDLKIIKKKNLLIGKGIRYRTASMIFRRSLEHLANRIRMRDIIRVTKRDGKKVVVVRRKDVITYYVNTVAHLFNDDNTENQ
jgi:glycerol-3-phosphate O-acyltransferase